MKDKKIIINKVNVSECVFLDNYSKTICNGFRADNSAFIKDIVFKILIAILNSLSTKSPNAKMGCEK